MNKLALELCYQDVSKSITIQLLTRQQNVDEEIAKAAADAVWNKMKSANIRDCVRIGRMAKSISDINFLVDSFSRS